MPERLYLTFDNRYDVPPEYALAWLTDFREDDMQAVGGAKMPRIKVTKLPDGRLQREFPMPMGLGSFRTVTRIEGKDRWVADCELRDRRTGDVVSRNRIVETVRPEGGGGTRHHVDLFQDDLTSKTKLMAA